MKEGSWPLLLIVAAIVIMVPLMWFTVVRPAWQCSSDGGQPVAGIGRIVCAQPFEKLKR